MRYAEEAGSGRLEQILGSASSLGVSAICVSEVFSALCRRRREGTLSPQEYLKAKGAFLEDLADSSLINLTDPVIARAIALLEQWPLRPSQSLQVASAAEWGTELFVSADARQCVAARGSGLRVEQLPLGGATD